MQYPGSSASLEQGNIAFTDNLTLLSLCHSHVEGMTMTFHHLLKFIHSTFVVIEYPQPTLPILFYLLPN